MRHLVGSIPGRGDVPFLACLLSLRQDNTFASSRWVGGGTLDGHVAFKASTLFPAVKDNLQLSMKIDLSSFDFPLSGSNLSMYREAPKDVAVTAFVVQGGKQVIFDWAAAKKEGCGDFCVRLTVYPISTSEVLVQLGAVPFGLDHLKQNYGEVYEEAYFPNTFLRVTKTRTQLPKGMARAAGQNSTSLAKRVELVLQDSQGFGLGVQPFISCLHFNPDTDPIPMPPFEAILEATCDFFRAGAQAVARNAAELPAALGIALLADKDARNLVGPVDSPWPAFTVLAAAAAGGAAGGGGGDVAGQQQHEGMSSSAICLNSVSLDAPRNFYHPVAILKIDDKLNTVEDREMHERWIHDSMFH